MRRRDIYPPRTLYEAGGGPTGFVTAPRSPAVEHHLNLGYHIGKRGSDGGARSGLHPGRGWPTSGGALPAAWMWTSSPRACPSSSTANNHFFEEVAKYRAARPQSGFRKDARAFKARDLPIS